MIKSRKTISSSIAFFINGIQPKLTNISLLTFPLIANQLIEPFQSITPRKNIDPPQKITESTPRDNTGSPRTHIIWCAPAAARAHITRVYEPRARDARASARDKHVNSAGRGHILKLNAAKLLRGRRGNNNKRNPRPCSPRYIHASRSGFIINVNAGEKIAGRRGPKYIRLLALMSGARAASTGGRFVRECRSFCAGRARHDKRSRRIYTRDNAGRKLGDWVWAFVISGAMWMFCVGVGASVVGIVLRAVKLVWFDFRRTFWKRRVRSCWRYILGDASFFPFVGFDYFLLGEVWIMDWQALSHRRIMFKTNSDINPRIEGRFAWDNTSIARGAHQRYRVLIKAVRGKGINWSTYIVVFLNNFKISFIVYWLYHSEILANK